MQSMKGKVDVIMMRGDIASDRNRTLIINLIKSIIIQRFLLLCRGTTDKTRILGYGADEFRF